MQTFGNRKEMVAYEYIRDSLKVYLDTTGFTKLWGYKVESIQAERVYNGKGFFQQGMVSKQEDRLLNMQGTSF